MPTDEWFRENPKVSAYIPKDLNEKLSDWMKDRNIKKVSQALTTILEEHLGVVQTEPITQLIRDDRLEAIEQELKNLSQIVQELRESAQASSLEVAQEVVQTELFPAEPIEEIALIDSRQPIEVIEEIQDRGLEQAELIKHEVWTTPQVNKVLEIGRNSLERWKRENAFPKTIKEHTILKWAGKQTKPPFGNLWEIKKLTTND